MYAESLGEISKCNYAMHTQLCDTIRYDTIYAMLKTDVFFTSSNQNRQLMKKRLKATQNKNRLVHARHPKVCSDTCSTSSSFYLCKRSRTNEYLTLTTVGAFVAPVCCVVLEGENGELRYYIVAGDSEAQFSIDEQLGIITVARSLDRETRSRYDLTIQAVDQAVDPAYRLSSSVVVSQPHHFALTDI